MASFLTLCGLLATRSGAIGAAPVSVTGQTGRQAKCVDWIMHSWELIQAMHQDWSFLQAEWEGELIASETTYTALSLNIATRFGEWKGDRMQDGRLYQPTTLYDPDIGQSGEGALQEIGYQAWRERYDRGTQTPNKPVHYCIAPDQTLRFGPVPDKAYVVRGEYVKAPQVLAANAEEPDMPVRFHSAIVDRGIILINETDGAVNDLPGAMRGFSEKLTAMRRDLLPDITTVLGR